MGLGVWTLEGGLQEGGGGTSLGVEMPTKMKVIFSRVGAFGKNPQNKIRK